MVLLALDQALGVLLCVDSEGIERHYPIARCETYELVAKHDLGDDSEVQA